MSELRPKTEAEIVVERGKAEVERVNELMKKRKAAPSG
jgi:hypothetical protein